MWKVQLAQGLWNFRQSTWLYLPPAAQAPSCVQRILLLLASPTAALQLCRICRAHPLVSPVSLHVHLHGTSLKPLPSIIRAGGTSSSPAWAGPEQAVRGAPWGVRLARLPTPQPHAEKTPAPHRCFGSACKHFLAHSLHLQHSTVLPPRPEPRRGFRHPPTDPKRQTTSSSVQTSGGFPVSFRDNPNSSPPQLPLPSLQPAGSRARFRSCAAAAQAGPPRRQGALPAALRRESADTSPSAPKPPAARRPLTAPRYV